MKSDTVHTIVRDLINNDRAIWQVVAHDLALARPALVESYYECDGDFSERHFDEHHTASAILGFAMADVYGDMLPFAHIGINGTRKELFRFVSYGCNPLLDRLNEEMNAFDWYEIASDIIDRLDYEALGMATLTDTQVFTEEQINAKGNSDLAAAGGESGQHSLLTAD